MNLDKKQKLSQPDLVYWVNRSSALYNRIFSWASLPIGCWFYWTLLSCNYDSWNP